MSVQVQAMQWSDTPDIEDVSRFNDDDKECLRDVRDVLRRHGMLDRFGMTLVHSHFPIADDEVLMETTDLENRTLRIAPMKATDAANLASRPTNWRFTEDEAIVAVGCRCRIQHGVGHSGGHEAF